MMWYALVVVLLAWISPGMGFEKACLECHEVAKGKVKHAPYEKGSCYDCHSPHVSKYPSLLKKDIPELCYGCHEKEEFLGKDWTHSPVEKGRCGECHAPHAAAEALLKKGPKELCVECHKGLKEKFEHLHKPFSEGKCFECHDPHGGSDKYFLKGSRKTLCFKCHEKEVVRRHEYGRKGMDCLECHDPHGGKGKALVRAFSHEPYAKGACKDCHSKSFGVEVCFSCHQGVEEEFFKAYNHYMRSKKEAFCLECHSPHLSEKKSLLRGSEDFVCVSCHEEALEKKRKSSYVHPSWQKCLECHEGHGSESFFLLKGGGLKVCVRCHETQGKFTHPVGAKVKDPRNGQEVTCVTCHDPMGTKFKYNLRLSGDSELCLECHKGY